MDSINKISGALYGSVLGDAFSVAFSQADTNVDDNVANSAIPPNIDWTPNTDIMLLVIESIQANDYMDTKDVARRLVKWLECGTITPTGPLREVRLHPNKLFNLIVSSPGFAEDAFAVATSTWEKSNKILAINDCLPRTIALLILEDPRDEVINLTKITACDPRCIISCVMYHTILERIIAGDTITTILEAARAAIPAEFATDDVIAELDEWINLANTGELNQLDLGAVNRSQYVFRGLACAIYALRIITVAEKNNRIPSFQKTIRRIASVGGDVSTNCSIAGAIIGAYLGKTALPNEWVLEMSHCEYLDSIINQCF